MDVELRRSLWQYVRTLRARGTTLVLTTHYLEEAEELADRVGVIDRGRLLVVEDKDLLLTRHGGRTLRVMLARPSAALPPALAAVGARLEDGGEAVSVEAGKDGALGPALAAVVAAGLPVKDVETVRTRLEDVFVRLVAGGRLGGDA